MPAFSILCFFSTLALVQVAARFSEGCESVAELLQLNMSKILALSRKVSSRLGWPLVHALSQLLRL